MGIADHFRLKAAATAAVVLAVAPVLFSPAAALAEPSGDLRPAVTNQPVALYIRLCLWSRQRPAEFCRDVPLTPGAGGPGFASIQACQDGQDEAMRRWRAEAGPVFGFTAMAGDGYRIDRMRCGLVEGG